MFLAISKWYINGKCTFTILASSFVSFFFVLDSHDFSFIRALDVDSCFDFKSASPMTVKLALTPNHLVAHVYTNTNKLVQMVRLFKS